MTEDEELEEIRAISDPAERARRATEFISGQTAKIAAVSAIRQEALEVLRDAMTNAEIADGTGLTRARISQLLGSGRTEPRSEGHRERRKGNPMTQRTPRGFGADFATLFQRSAFRLELLDRYTVAAEEEPYRRFLAGEPQDPAWREPWAQLVRDAVREGKRMSRVHVVTEPLSDYLRFEFTCGYPASAEAGEDIRILRRASWPHLLLPDHDFWLFDDREAAAMDYDTEGNWLGAGMTADPEMIGRYRLVRDRAMEHSVPLADYLRE